MVMSYDLKRSCGRDECVYFPCQHSQDADTTYKLVYNALWHPSMKGFLHIGLRTKTDQAKSSFKSQLVSLQYFLPWTDAHNYSFIRLPNGESDCFPALKEKGTPCTYKTCIPGERLLVWILIKDVTTTKHWNPVQKLNRNLNLFV